jgi:hypothetical protein
LVVVWSVWSCVDFLVRVENTENTLPRPNKHSHGVAEPFLRLLSLFVFSPSVFLASCFLSLSSLFFFGFLCSWCVRLSSMH